LIRLDRLVGIGGIAGCYSRTYTGRSPRNYGDGSHRQSSVQVSSGPPAPSSGGHASRQQAAGALHRRHPCSLQTSFYPTALVASGAYRLIEAPDIPGGSVAYLRDALDVVQVGYRDSVVIRTPDQDESTFFKLPNDGRIPVISLMRTGYQASDAGPTPFRVVITVLPPDRNQLVINSGEVPSTLAAAVRP
jgi:hypothetical protein